MQNAISTIEKNNALAIYWNPFDRWSGALTGLQFYASGVSGQQITNSVLAFDPVLNVPNIVNKYSHIELVINAEFFTQQSNGADAYPFTLNNLMCGFIPGYSGGIKIDGTPSQFAFSGNKAKLRLQSLPSVIDFTRLWLVYAIDSSYNNVAFPLSAPGSKYVGGFFNVSIIGYGSN
jgi:hypothetical protein